MAVAPVLTPQSTCSAYLPSRGGRAAVPAPRAASGPPGPADGRDLFLDALRLLVIAMVVLQHWLLPVLSYSGETLVQRSVLDVPGAFTITWVVQVMPLIFFVGGACNAMSWRTAALRGEGASGWLARRLRRLAWPVVPLAGVWLALSSLAIAGGVAEQPVRLAAQAAGMVLWFLAAYLMVVVLTPVMLGAEDRFGWRALAALLVGAAAVDILRFTTGIPEIGYLNVAFVWLAAHQLGFRYASGALSRGPAAAMAVLGFGAAVTLAASGPYSPNMTGVFTVEASNAAPPTLVLAALAVGQVGLAMLLRDRILAWTTRGTVARLLDWARPRLMTVYLWHLLPTAVVAGIAVVGLGIATPQPLTGAWLLWCALAVGLLAPLLWPLVRYAARFEEPPRVPYGKPGLVRILAAAALICGGLIALTVVGLAPSLASIMGLLAIAGGLALTWSPARRTRAGTPAAGRLLAGSGLKVR